VLGRSHPQELAMEVLEPHAMGAQGYGFGLQDSQPETGGITVIEG
jgi:hypothetical protein